MYRIAPSAKLDLENIWNYTYQNFGEAQANSYLDKLYAEFGIISDMPKLGVDQSTMRAGYRSKHCMRHKIYYRQTDGSIIVMRVLHERMSPELNI